MILNQYYSRKYLLTDGIKKIDKDFTINYTVGGFLKTTGGTISGIVVEKDQEQLLPEKCVISTSSGLFCDDFTSSSTDNTITLRIRNILSDVVTVISIKTDNPNCINNRGLEIPPGDFTDFKLSCPSIQVGEEIKTNIEINYKLESGLTKRTTGQLITKAKELGCEDECSSDSCSGLDYTECLMQSDGCKDKKFRGKIKGKCGVECTTDNDCSSDEKCEDYKCIEESQKSYDVSLSINNIKCEKDGDNTGYINRIDYEIKNKGIQISPKIEISVYSEWSNEVMPQKVIDLGIALGPNNNIERQDKVRVYFKGNSQKIRLMLLDGNTKIMSTVKEFRLTECKED